MVDGFLRREKLVLDPVVDVLSLEPYPIAFPALGLRRVVGVPFAWKKQVYVAGLDGCLFAMRRLERAFTFRKVKKLVLVEDPSLVFVEKVAIGMSLGGVSFPGLYVIEANGADSEAPFGISFSR